MAMVKKTSTKKATAKKSTRPAAVEKLDEIIESGVTREWGEDLFSDLEDHSVGKNRYDVYEINQANRVMMLAENVSWDKAELLVRQINFSRPGPESGGLIVPYGFDYFAYIAREAGLMICMYEASKEIRPLLKTIQGEQQTA